MINEFKDNTLAWAKKCLGLQLEKFPRAREVEVFTNVRQGVPYDEILKEAKEERIDLIVIASLGRTGIAKYLIGSVARNVLKGSKCPVLLTK
jgi:nucleotide-binding universal stress UspA family protein